MAASGKREAGSQVAVGTPNKPGYQHLVDAVKYETMRKALMKVLPKRGPGLTQAEMFDAAEELVPAELYPNHGRVCWWAKTVQLDLESRGVLVRSKEGGLTRWRRA